MLCRDPKRPCVMYDLLFLPTMETPSTGLLRSTAYPSTFIFFTTMGTMWRKGLCFHFNFFVAQ